MMTMRAILTSRGVWRFLMGRGGGLYIDLYDIMYCITLVRSIACTGLDRSLNEALIGERS